MSEMFIAKGDFPGIIERLMSRYRVYAPVKDGRYYEFAALKEAGAADLGFKNTRMSPKGVFHPQAERMFEYSLAKDDPEVNIVKETPKDFSPQVILGIRPCDAKAFTLDDANFCSDKFKDPWWAKRREATTLIGLACNSPSSTCFCTTVNTGPFDTTGLDAMLVDTGDGYALQVLTEKGKNVLGIVDLKPAPAQVAGKIEELKAGAEKSIATAFDPAAIAQKDVLEIFNAPIWDEIHFGCLNCGTCTFMCPTCWCFDIQDEVQEGAKGDRLRLWDSCMFSLFTFHGSGHNPRAQKVQRVRQRFMHKLKYYQDKYGTGTACVGCGRCVQACPVNIDIRQVGRTMGSGCSCPA